MINKLVYEEGIIKNSGGGWHRDAHDCQFKVLMYLSDVNEKNGCFQFITNSSKNLKVRRIASFLFFPWQINLHTMLS